MNKKYIITLIAVLVILMIGVLYFLYNQQVQPISITNTTYPQSSGFNFYPINEIKSNKFNSGTFNTEGYVVKIYTCPLCPAGAQCKPCMRDNIVISENNKLLEAYSLSDKEMILFVDNPKQFELGEKYTFSIKILDHKSTSEPINDVEIVGYNSGTTLNGMLVKNGWEKSLESYCAQGSDYFTLKTINNEALVLEFEPAYTETQMSNFSGKNVTITGEKKSKKIECPEGSQCPLTPSGVFTCEVFKINKIIELKPTDNSVLDPSGKVTNNNLQTYRNEKFGFEFNYPKKLKLITRNGSRDSKEIYLIDDPIGHPDDWYFENDIPDYSNPYLDKAIWLSVYPDQPTVEQFISWRFGKPNWNFTTETISGISALRSTHVVVDFSSGPKDQAMIIFDKNNTAYMWLTTDTQGKSNNADLLNQIISSFKFIK